MGTLTDVMVDIETTGTAINDQTGIIQIAALKFNYETGEIGDYFDRCLALAPLRYWDMDTHHWWMGRNRETFNEIITRSEPAETVMRDFYQWSTDGTPHGGFRFWGKPVSFDFPLINSYFRQFGYEMPYHFRIARDLNTYIAAMAGGVTHQKMEHVTSEGAAHHALADVVHQLKMLFAAKERNFGDYAEFEEIKQ